MIVAPLLLATVTAATVPRALLTPNRICPRGGCGRMLVRREVSRIPDGVVQLAMTTRFYKATRNHESAAALDVRRNGMRSNARCQFEGHDRVDLSIPLRRGFRLVWYEAQPLESTGFVQLWPLEALAVSTVATEERRQATLQLADTIRIRPPLAVETFSDGTVSCRSDYRPRITFEGPMRRDPFALPVIDGASAKQRSTNLARD